MNRAEASEIVHRAEFRNYKVPAAIALLIVAELLGVALFFRDPRAALLGGCALAALAWIRLRVRLVLTDEYFEYVGPIFRRRVAWGAITRARHVSEAGYPADRLYGPHVHEFWTGDDVARVSLLFFAPATRHELLSRARVCTR